MSVRWTRRLAGMIRSCRISDAFFMVVPHRLRSTRLKSAFGILIGLSRRDDSSRIDTSKDVFLCFGISTARRLRAIGILLPMTGARPLRIY